MLSNNIPIDDMFDLDLALDMPDDYSSYSTEETIANDQPQLNATEPKAAEEIVAEMPTVVIAGGGGGRCTVCMEGFRLGGVGGKQIPCGHIFHGNCIALWISAHDSCPLCRCPVSSTTNTTKYLL